MERGYLFPASGASPFLAGAGGAVSPRRRGGGIARRGGVAGHRLRQAVGAKGALLDRHLRTTRTLGMCADAGKQGEELEWKRIGRSRPLPVHRRFDEIPELGKLSCEGAEVGPSALDGIAVDEVGDVPVIIEVVGECTGIGIADRRGEDALGMATQMGERAAGVAIEEVLAPGIEARDELPAAVGAVARLELTNSARFSSSSRQTFSPV